MAFEEDERDHEVEEAERRAFLAMMRHRFPCLSSDCGPLERWLSRIPFFGGDPRLVGVFENGIAWGVVAGSVAAFVGVFAWVVVYRLAWGSAELGWSKAMLIFVEATVLGVLVGRMLRR